MTVIHSTCPRCGGAHTAMLCMSGRGFAQPEYAATCARCKHVQSLHDGADGSCSAGTGCVCDGFVTAELAAELGMAVTAAELGKAIALHHYGQCKCFGKGRCEWCRTSAAEARASEMAAELELLGEVVEVARRVSRLYPDPTPSCECELCALGRAIAHLDAHLQGGHG